MELGRFEIEIEDKKINEICSIMLNEQIDKIHQICERYGEYEEEVRKYNVYVVNTPSGSKVLKRAEVREVTNYEKYLKQRDFNVPQYYGKWEDGQYIWILLENILGEDLRNMTNELAISAANSITVIQNHYWGCEDSDRFDAYWKRINKRYQYIKNDSIIGEAYCMFLERQITCPRTMSNGDFLEFNAVSDREDKVIILDWGFGGIMPYSLDIARFIAHATENRATFPFYMNEKQKKLFVENVYEKLQRKPEYEQYLFDIKLAILNEYVEFMEADEDENNWYRDHALEIAKEILESKKL